MAALETALLPGLTASGHRRVCQKQELLRWRRGLSVGKGLLQPPVLPPRLPAGLGPLTPAAQGPPRVLLLLTGGESQL